MGRVLEKVAIVTGGASGLGKSIAHRLVSEGAIVVVTDIQSELGVSVAEELGCHFIEQDVTQEDRWSEVIGQVEQKYGALNILVNNAGILGPTFPAGPEDTRLLDWKKIFSINVESVFLGCRAAIPAMRRSKGGSIINISSIAALVASPYATAYGSSKAAVRQLTKSIAQDCAQNGSGVRCNSVHPGIILTPLTQSNYVSMAKERNVSIDIVIDEMRSLIPMGEFTEESDIASAVLYLASDESKSITGTKIIVDGGYVNCETYLSQPACEK